MKISLKERLSDRHFWMKSGIFLLIFISIVSCDPVFQKAFWLWKGEIVDTVLFWRKIFPYAIVLLSLALVVKRKGKIHYGALLLIAFVWLGYYISCWANGISLSTPWDTFLMSGEMFLLALVCCNDEDCKRLYLHAASDMYLFAALFNLFLVYVLFKLYPEYIELNGEVLIGTHNHLGFMLYLGMLFCLLDDHMSGTKRSRIKLILYILLMAINTYWNHKSATGIVGAAILILYLIPPLRKLTEKTPFAIFLGANIFLFVMLMFFFDEFTNFAPVKFLITQVLHKKITFTGRVYIWQGIMEEIKLHPVKGYGLIGGSFYFDDIFNHKFVHCHNQYLQAWHEAGILGLISPLVMFGFVGWRLDHCPDRHLAGIFKIVLFVLMLTLQTDQMPSCPYYLLCMTAHLALLLIPSGKAIDKPTDTLPT